MNFVTPICPQCGAPLPRQALWRTVVCAHCLAEVTRSADVVHAADFAHAYRRARHDNEPAATIACHGERYRVLRTLGHGTRAKVVMAQRLGALPERVVIKLGDAHNQPGAMRAEAAILRQLQDPALTGSAYFSQRLPQVVADGVAQGLGLRPAEALVLRSPVGYWGSLEDVRRHHRQGVDPRHAVWMWRRMLEVLGYVHAAGWVHGRLAPEHLLVNPADHGILIIGWSQARRIEHSVRDATAARDLMQAAWSIRSLLHGADVANDADGAEGARQTPPIGPGLPAPLATLLKRASEERHWCAQQGAAGIDQALKAAALAAFGAPRFIPFTPTPTLT